MRSFTPQRSPHPQNDKSWLFRLVTKGLKYYLLMVFGFVVSLLLAEVIGVFHIVEPTLPAMGQLFGRLALILLCLGAIAVVFESIRS